MNTITQFMALDQETRNAFHNVAAKSDQYHNGYEVFAHEIPASVADNPEAVEILLDGGTATVVREVGDRGVAGGGYTETETIEFPDRDFSRHVSGKNGGEYSPENVTLEDASTNRARGAENMTETEITAAETSLEADAEILSNAEVLIPADTIMVTREVTPEVVTMETGPAAPLETFGEISEVIAEAAVPVYIAYKAASYVSSKCDTTEEKIGYGALAAGLGAVIAATPVIGPTLATGVFAYSIGKLASRFVEKYC